MNTKPRDELYCGVNKEKILSSEPKINPENYSHLIHFMKERFMIHIKKDVLKESAPWTDDPVLQSYRFTNVFREDDFVTKALIECAQSSYLSYEEKVLNTVLFRAWNNPDTFRIFWGPWKAEAIYDSDKLKKHIRPLFRKLSEQDQDRLWFSAAYNQGGTKRACQCRNLDGTGEYEPDIPLRIFHIGAWMKELDFVNEVTNAANQKEAFEKIRAIRGFAEFLAYQVFVDLTYIPEFPFSENEFVIAGPGCKKGLDYIFQDPAGLSYSEQLFKLRDYLKEESDLVQLFEEHGKTINVMSVENCMCEISKYIRAVNGTGRPRNHYKPRKEVQ